MKYNYYYDYYYLIYIFYIYIFIIVWNSVDKYINIKIYFNFFYIILVLEFDFLSWSIKEIQGVFIWKYNKKNKTAEHLIDL